MSISQSDTSRLERSPPDNGNRVCRGCQGDLRLLIDFGLQPRSNIQSDIKKTVERFLLQLGQCDACGLLQLMDLLSVEQLTPDRPLPYTEPESHLDEVADLILRLPGINRNARCCGVSFKDQSTIDRLRSRGCSDARCLHTLHDLGIQNAAAGLEWIQQRISLGAFTNRDAHFGAYQVVIARHILEHAHQLDLFIAGLRSLMAPNGYLVVEVPDFANSLMHRDYSTLWEDHAFYFTSETLKQTLRQFGFTICGLNKFTYVPEDSLVVIATRDDHGQHELQMADALATNLAEQEITLGKQYAQDLEATRRQWHERLALERAAERSIAMLGAGHLGIMFLNLMNLSNVIELILDDDPAKLDKFVPGTQRPISKVSDLDRAGIDLCLLSVSPNGEKKVVQRNQQFLNRGGRFGSIFPNSSLAYHNPSDRSPKNRV